MHASLILIQLILVTNLPKGRFSKSNNSALQEDAFERGAIKNLVDNGLISEQYQVPFVTNPLSVSVVKGGSF